MTRHKSHFFTHAQNLVTLVTWSHWSQWSQWSHWSHGHTGHNGHNGHNGHTGQHWVTLGNIGSHWATLVTGSQWSQCMGHTGHTGSHLITLGHNGHTVFKDALQRKCTIIMHNINTNYIIILIILLY